MSEVWLKCTHTNTHYHPLPHTHANAKRQLACKDWHVRCGVDRRRHAVARCQAVIQLLHSHTGVGLTAERVDLPQHHTERPPTHIIISVGISLNIPDIIITNPPTRSARTTNIPHSHVTLGCVLALSQRLGSHPLNRQATLWQYDRYVRNITSLIT